MSRMTLQFFYGNFFIRESPASTAPGRPPCAAIVRGLHRFRRDFFRRQLTPEGGGRDRAGDLIFTHNFHAGRNAGARCRGAL